MLPEQNIFEARSGFPLEKRHALILLVWAVQICCVVIGSLLSPESSVIGPLVVCTSASRCCIFAHTRR
jgi:hypothetical protein